MTPSDRLIVDTFADSAKSLGYGRKEIAAFQDLNEAQWRRQYEAEDGQHVSTYRLARMPAPVMRESISRLGRAYGLRTFDERDKLVTLIESNQDLIDITRELLRQERRQA